MPLADKVSAYNRNRKWLLFLQHMRPDNRTRVLDVGFNATEYSSVDNYLEKHYEYPENITALGLDSPVEFQKRYPKVRVVQYDGASSLLRNSFDGVVQCVIEMSATGRDKCLLKKPAGSRRADHHWTNRMCRSSAHANSADPLAAHPVRLNPRRTARSGQLMTHALRTFASCPTSGEGASASQSSTATVCLDSRWISLSCSRPVNTNLACDALNP